jgi:hypothetical protein
MCLSLICAVLALTQLEAPIRPEQGMRGSQRVSIHSFFQQIIIGF